MLSWQLKTCPNAQKVAVNTVEDIGLSTCISVETLKLIWAAGERRNNLSTALPKPVTGPPLQEGEYLPHLLLKE